MLPQQTEFARLVRQVRDHDPAAFAELMRCYEADVCRMVESHLRNTRLGRLVDAGDVWQVVLLRFFTLASNGHFDLDDPAQLLHLLQKIATNELRDQARWGSRERRSLTRELAGNDRALGAVADWHAGPAQVAEEHDLLDNVLHRLHRKERELAVGWAEGKDWDELARETGGTAESARKQFARAMTRLAGQLSVAL
jgi:RNA polymerase sigma factor (sigma-70 family)